MKGRHFAGRLICLVMVALLVSLTAMPAMAAKNPSGAYIVATSKGSNLNMRSGPGILYGVTAKLPRGAIVVYQSSSKGWWKVMYCGGEGYVDPTYLWSVDRSPAAQYSSVDNLYVRAQPSVFSFAYGKLRPGRLVTIVRQKGTWSLINYRGYTGWAASKYLFRVR